MIEAVATITSAKRSNTALASTKGATIDLPRRCTSVSRVPDWIVHAQKIAPDAVFHEECRKSERTKNPSGDNRRDVPDCARPRSTSSSRLKTAM